MAVRFILGPAGSGKTRYCLTGLRQLELAGRPGIFLVPEQFTYTAERSLLEPREMAGLRHVHVFSFTRFGWWLRDLAAAPPVLAISPIARPMLLRSILSRLDAADLGPLAPLRARQGLLDELSSFIREVRNHGSVDFLDAVRRIAEEPSSPGAASPVPAGLRKKVAVLGCLFEMYNTALRDMSRIDPEQKLHGLEPVIAGCREEVARTEFFVDGFLSWTRREREILVALALTGARMHIALCCERPQGDRIPLIPATRSLEGMTRQMEAAGVTVEEPLLLAGPHRRPARFMSARLALLERQLFALDGGSPETAARVPPQPEAVTLQAARDLRQEVEIWARRIDAWVRDPLSPTPPERIAVVVRSLEPYRDLVRQVFPRYHIPVFLDESISILSRPRVRLLLDAIEVVLSGWRRDRVIAFLRNPLLGAAPAAIDLLENTSLEYGKDFRAFTEPQWEEYSIPPRLRARRADHEADDGASEFDDRERQPRLDQQSFDPEDLSDEDAGNRTLFPGHREPQVIQPEGTSSPRGPTEPSSAMRRLDALRLRLLRPILLFESRWGFEDDPSSARDGDEAVALLVEMSAALREASGVASEEPEGMEARVERAIVEVLDEARALWKGVPITLEEFARGFGEGLEATRLGMTPLRLGQVIVAEIQRSRLGEVDRVVVGGLNEGLFPRRVEEETLLNERERQALAPEGLRLGPPVSWRQEEEIYLFYIALTRASRELLLTWSESDLMGKALAPSLLLDEVERVLQQRRLPPPPDVSETPATELRTIEEAGERIIAGLAAAAGQTGLTVAANDAGLEADNQADPAVGANDAGLAAAAHDAGQMTPAAEQRPAARLAFGGDPALIALYNRAATGMEDPVSAYLRQVLDRARPALLYNPEDLLPAGILRHVFPPGDHASSVSRLLEYATCPYQSFSKNLLRLHPRPLLEISPLDTGRLAHAALERFFRGRIRGAGAPGEIPVAEMEDQLAGIFRELSTDPEFRAFSVDETGIYQLQSARLRLARYLEAETARLRGCSFQSFELEFGFGPEARSALLLPLGGGDRLALRGRIDRLDVRKTENGVEALVIDYKLRPKSGLPARLEKGLDLQLAAYLLFLRDVLGYRPVGGLYAPVLPSPRSREKCDPGSANPLGIQMHGLILASYRNEIDQELGMLVRHSPQLVAPERMDELLEQGRRFLTGYARTMRRGWIAPAPLEETPGQLPCANCDFGAVCRFRPRRDRTRRQAADGILLDDDQVEGHRVVDGRVEGDRVVDGRVEAGRVGADPHQSKRVAGERVERQPDVLTPDGGTRTDDARVVEPDADSTSRREAKP